VVDTIVGLLLVGFLGVPFLACLLVLVLALRRAFAEGPQTERSTLDFLLERNETPGRWGWYVAGWSLVGVLVFGVGLFAFALPGLLG